MLGHQPTPTTNKEAIYMYITARIIRYREYQSSRSAI